MAPIGSATLELVDFRNGDRTRHRLSRAAKAARYVESVTAGVERDIANAIATEIENAI